MPPINHALSLAPDPAKGERHPRKLLPRALGIALGGLRKAGRELARYSSATMLPQRPFARPTSRCDTPQSQKISAVPFGVKTSSPNNATSHIQ